MQVPASLPWSLKTLSSTPTGTELSGEMQILYLPEELQRPPGQADSVAEFLDSWYSQTQSLGWRGEGSIIPEGKVFHN